MLTLSPCLNQFLEIVPVASQAIAPANALETMTGAGCDRLVLLDERQRPAGIVRLGKLVPCLIQTGAFPALGLSTGGQNAQPGPPPESSRHLSQRPLVEVFPALVEPLPSLWSDLPLPQFLQRGVLPDGANYAVVDEQCVFLGLLSHGKILAFLAAASAKPAQKSGAQTSAPAAQRSPQSALTSASRTIVPAPAASSDPHGLPLPPLLELLKRLPLPLMLQTSRGQVLAHTDLWVQQAEQLLDPAEVGLYFPTLGFPTVATVADPQTGALPATGLDTSMRVCSLKTGKEKILQFVRIPLGSLNLTQSTAALTATRQPAERHPADSLDGQVLHNRAAGDMALTETLWLVLAQDITEQEQLAQELTAKNSDLIQLNRLKDEFLACISHELRTPLTAVLGLSTLLKDQTLGQLNPRQVHYAQLIYQSGRHLMTVVNDILDLTRMETGQLELVPEPVDIRVACDRAIVQAKQLRLLDDKQIDGVAAPVPQVTLNVEADLEFFVADELRLRQMLVHLLSNAFKFTEADQPVGLNVNRWGGWVAFTVWDTGIGIPADQQHLIFQKFKQLENPLTRRFEGTGLGLALTQRLARLHGGDVTFISKEGEGSQFTILLPPTPPEPLQSAGPESTSAEARSVEMRNAESRNAEAKSADLGDRLARPNLDRPAVRSTPAAQPFDNLLNRNRLVLVVEASPQSVESLSGQLTGLGYRVVIARSGTEALEKARRLQPCLIFLNPVLPLLSGWDVLTLLKSSPTMRHIPVVITATQVEVEAATSSLADRFISLPIQEKILRQTLRHLLLETADPAPVNPTGKLTILHLSAGLYNNDPDQNQSLVDDLNQRLHSHDYRVLEADDLEQAELLARVWKPKVVMLSGMAANWDLYFQQFSQYTFLASLPLVTLNPETTQAANQISGLLVFPCLALLQPHLLADHFPSSEEFQEPSALLQVIQVAAGYSWQPLLLAVDLSRLPSSASPDSRPLNGSLSRSLSGSLSESLSGSLSGAVSGSFSGPMERPPAPLETLGSLPQEAEWLQALTQYLGTAGFRALIGRSWQEVWQQMETQSADLLLVSWTATTVDDSTRERLAALQSLTTRPPILVLDHRPHEATQALVRPLPPALTALATQILPPTIAMSDLLDQIHQAMR